MATRPFGIGLRRVWGAGLVVSALTLVGPALPVAAQVAPRCPSTGLSLPVNVEIDEPLPDADVSGIVMVEGRVVPSLFRPSRAELVVRGAVVDSAALEPEAPAPLFSLRWNSGSAGAGPTELKVVACGDGTGSLARGEKTVQVNVAPVVTTTLVRGGGGTPSPTSIAIGPPGTTVTQNATSPTTRATRAPVTTAASGEPDISDRLPLLPDATASGGFPEVDEPPAGESPPLTEPLVLQDARDEAPARRPPWLGLVVGASGVMGLVLSTLLRRRNDRGRRRGGRGGGGRGPARRGRAGGRYERRPDQVERDLASLSGRP